MPLISVITVDIFEYAFRLLFLDIRCIVKTLLMKKKYIEDIKNY
jgi:hypothetical protein